MTDIIEIEITGPTASGKTAIMQTIKKELERHHLIVAVLDRSERHNPSDPLEFAANHEKPKSENCVIVIREKTIPRGGQA